MALSKLAHLGEAPCSNLGNGDVNLSTHRSFVEVTDIVGREAPCTVPDRRKELSTWQQVLIITGGLEKPREKPPAPRKRQAEKPACASGPDSGCLCLYGWEREGLLLIGGG